MRQQKFLNKDVFNEERRKKSEEQVNEITQRIRNRNSRILESDHDKRKYESQQQEPEFNEEHSENFEDNFDQNDGVKVIKSRPQYVINEERRQKRKEHLREIYKRVQRRINRIERKDEK